MADDDKNAAAAKRAEKIASDKAAADKKAAEDKAASDKKTADDRVAADKKEKDDAVAPTKADGTGEPLTHVEAVQKSGDDSGGASMKMDPEMMKTLKQDTQTRDREKMKREVREDDEEGSHERLSELHEDLVAAQKDVDEAIRRRDGARDAHDREAERLKANEQNPSTAAVDYVAAQNREREKQAALVRRSRGE